MTLGYGVDEKPLRRLVGVFMAEEVFATMGQPPVKIQTVGPGLYWDWRVDSWLWGILLHWFGSLALLSINSSSSCLRGEG